MTVRVLIYARYPTVQFGLRAAAEVDPNVEVVEATASADDLLDLVALELPDVILADVDLSSEELEPLGDLPDLPPVLLLVDRDDEVPDALRAGVRGVLLRDTDAESLSAALHALTQNLIVVDARAGILATANEPGSGALMQDPLTPREIEVLELIARGLPNKGIALELGISEHTVKFHVGSILAKFDASSRSEALARAMAAGLITV